jgi:hypothetical protein
VWRVLFIGEYDVFRYIRTLHEVRPSSAFVRYWLLWGFAVYDYLWSFEEIPLISLEVINQPC